MVLKRFVHYISEDKIDSLVRGEFVGKFTTPAGLSVSKTISCSFPLISQRINKK